MLALRLREFGVEERNGDYSKFDRHEKPNEVINELQHGPSLHAEEPPGTWREHEGVPGGDGERTYEKVLVRRQVGREVERGRQKVRDVGSSSTV